ncbi:MAG: hypothetical protein SFY96_04915 [Planctomycetota bacterium]|nr:hypothetical protein [Planctomycetota bacterium]
MPAPSTDLITTSLSRGPVIPLRDMECRIVALTSRRDVVALWLWADADDKRRLASLAGAYPSNGSIDAIRLFDADTGAPLPIVGGGFAQDAFKGRSFSLAPVSHSGTDSWAPAPADPTTLPAVGVLQPIALRLTAPPAASAIRVSIDTAQLAYLASDWGEQSRGGKPATSAFDRSFILRRAADPAHERPADAIYAPESPARP